MTSSTDPRTPWTRPALTVLNVSFDTANGEGSGGDGEVYSTIPS